MGVGSLRGGGKDLSARKWRGVNFQWNALEEGGGQNFRVALINFLFFIFRDAPYIVSPIRTTPSLQMINDRPLIRLDFPLDFTSDMKREKEVFQ